MRDRLVMPDSAARFEVRVTVDGHFAWLRTRLSLEPTMMSWLRIAVAIGLFAFFAVPFRLS